MSLGICNLSVLQKWKYFLKQFNKYAPETV